MENPSIIRETVDQAIYDFVKACGHNADDYDYSDINNELDTIEG